MHHIAVRIGMWEVDAAKLPGAVTRQDLDARMKETMECRPLW